MGRLLGVPLRVKRAVVRAVVQARRVAHGVRQDVARAHALARDGQRLPPVRQADVVGQARVVGDRHGQRVIGHGHGHGHGQVAVGVLKRHVNVPLK